MAVGKVGSLQRLVFPICMGGTAFAISRRPVPVGPVVGNVVDIAALDLDVAACTGFAV